MRNDRYLHDISDSYKTYKFLSEGPKGQISKVIRYTEIQTPNFYNLGFGDQLGNTDDFDDRVVSNNKDSVKVLATVAATVYLFTSEYPKAFVFAKGNTPARTRLYQMGISNNLEEILEDFIVVGILDDSWEIFKKNKNYTTFLITRKWNLL